VIEEQIVAEGRGESFELNGESAQYIRTLSSFDRSVEPNAGPAPELKIPVIWTLTAANEMGIYGIETAELPLVEFSLDINGGLLLDDPGKVGVANLVATMLNRGTANRTPAELEAAIEQLGAVLQVSAGREGIRVSGRTLSSRFDETMALMTEMLLEPRWDSAEFSLAKQAVLGELAEQQAEPNAIANNLFNTLLYGEANILSNNLLGTVASVGDIRLQDLQTWYAANLVPSLADFHITGDVSAVDVESAIADFVNGWDNRAVTVPDPIFPEPREDAVVYFYDVPGARQSVLRIGKLALAATDEDYWPASVMNYILGGGGFASRLTQELREGKGYTYGIRSRFDGSVYTGPFQISSGVRTNITLEALESVIEILSKYPATFSETDLATTKSFLLASNARRFETFAAKLDMLRDISNYGYANDYVLAQEAFVESVAIDDIKTLAQRYADPGKLIYLVVGDAATQRERLEALGLPVISLN
jgi:zinc protease